MRINKNHWLITKPIAHRGLWGQNIIENSLSAYKNAVDKGYPIEIDVYSTIDGEIVSFHDENLFRMTGENGKVYNKSLAELKSLSLLGSQEKIPTLIEVLNIVNGKTPLLIEIKNQPDESVVEKMVMLLKDYNGEFAIQSFNPRYLIKVKKLAPEFLRGVLSSKKPDANKSFHRFMVKHMPLNFIIKPDFISHDYSGLPLKNKKTPVIAWTVIDNATAQKIKPFADNIIFENFVPD